ncbi:hypothetical protein H8356DRAFT_1359353 [Neocallimastix lanati (nom. inval.)]|nr:hypothetical protein H8356DRAFT_1359353 [Neocallimastix sp. JGI-2020a]
MKFLNIKEFGTFIFIIKHKIKEESLRKCSIFLSIKPNSIFNEVSQEKGFICPEYSIIRYQIIRSISNQLNLDKTTFNEMPIESEYYKTKKAKLFSYYSKVISLNSLLYKVPKLRDKNMEKELICNSCNRNSIVELCFSVLAL